MDKSAHKEERIASFTGDSKSYDSHTEECAGSMTTKDILIRKLRDDLEQARKQQQGISRELRDTKLDVARQQGLIGKLQDEKSLKMSDVTAKDHNIRALELQFRDSKVEVCGGRLVTGVGWVGEGGGGGGCTASSV